MPNKKNNIIKFPANPSKLERQVEDAVDIWKVTNEQIYGGKGYIVEICNLKEKNRQLKSENRMIKKFLERAKIVVDEIR